jgi:hypothetical protein
MKELIDIGTSRQLFINGTFIEKSESVDLIVHAPAKTGELNIVADKPWEHKIGGYNSVLFFNGAYHMWYTIMGLDTGSNAVGYAISEDGIIWQKPDLGLAADLPNGGVNVVLGFGAAGISGGLFDGSLMVFEDPHANADKQLKMTIRLVQGAGLSLFSSKDGRRWIDEGSIILTDHRKYNEKGEFIGDGFHLDSQNVILWDDRIGSYITYARKNFDFPGQRRTVARGVSPDLFNFADAAELNVVLAPDELDPTMDYYTNAAVKYPWADNVYLMFPSAYYKYEGWFGKLYGEEPRNAGPMDIRFAASRDGISWNRFNRRPYVALGRRGSFDDASLYMVHGVVPGDGENLYMYYSGSDINHGWGRQDDYREPNNRILTDAGFAPLQDTSAISRLIVRQDGFTSVRGHYSGGSFETPQMRFSGSRLILNADTSALGEIRVGLRRGDGTPIPGFEIEECIPVHSVNDTRIGVRWRGGINLSSIRDTPLKMEFCVRDADLYSFQFTED